jgi:phosphoenolpyruvate-protein phosphotransferase
MTPATLTLRAFVSGTVVPIEAVPDPVFAERMVGDGIAIDPRDGVVRAPCAGRLVQLHASQHACMLEADSGARVLLHVGLDTVLLRGEGFVARVAVGQQVAAGQPLIEFDARLLQRHGKPALTVLAVENSDQHRIVWRSPASGVTVGDELLVLVDALAVQAAGEPPVPPGDAGAGAPAEAPAVASGWATVRHAGGLHVRPSALVAAALKPFAATVEIEAGPRRVPARSATRLMELAVEEGQRVQVIAHGPDAAAALAAAVQALETAPPAAHASPRVAVPAGMAAAAAADAAAAPSLPGLATASSPAGMVTAHGLPGVAASPGLALGVTARFEPAEAEVREVGEGPVPERRALQAALQAVAGDIASAVSEAQRRGLADQAGIFAAHQVLAEDPELFAHADGLIAAGKSAAFAWRAAVQLHCRALQATGLALLAERAGDLQDIQRQVLRKLAGGAGGVAAAPALPPGAVLLADDLAPSDFALLERAGVAAVVTARGGPTSHVAILARAHGIPALVAVGPLLAEVPAGLRVIVDADRGLLHTQAGAAQLAEAQRELERRTGWQAQARARAQLPAHTTDGAHIEVLANVATAAEARQVLALGAEGVGLLRTELLFLERATAPTPAEQQAAYQAVVDALQGRGVVIRTLDVGADKTLPYIAMPAEENPALGLRGVRLGLARPALLAEQLGALLAVRPAGAVRILLPMVNDVMELRQVRAVLDRLAEPLGLPQRMPLGVMIETPAAALLADQLAREADFFSIGTNDLAQYALCMDRCNPALAAQLDGLHPAVLRLIGQAVAGAEKHGRRVGVCGAMASEPLAVPLLVGLGVTELSASPAVIPEIKAVVRRLALADCCAAAQRALQLDSADAIRALVRDTWPWMK